MIHDRSADDLGTLVYGEQVDEPTLLGPIRVDVGDELLHFVQRARRVEVVTKLRIEFYIRGWLFSVIIVVTIHQYS